MKTPSIGEFEELVLLMVAAQHNQAYGVSILEALEEQTQKKLNISAIHVSLKRMEEKGLVESRFGGITADRGGRRKKFYVITAFGKQALDDRHAVRNAIYNQIPNIQFN